MLMVRDNRAGRPPLAGERYACGRRKPDTNARANNIWRRVVDDGIRFGLDPRLGTVIGRLSLHGEITDRQAEAGFHIAKIYGEFERHHRRCRSTVSPSYARAFGDPDAAEERMDPDELARLERRVQLATKRYKRLQAIIDDLPVNHDKARDVIERLCVEDREIDACHLGSVRAMLDRIGVKLRKKDPNEQGQPHPIAITARQPPRPPAPIHRAARPDMSREAFLHVMRMQGHDDQEGLAAWDSYLALKERERFRRGKLVRS